MQLSELLGSTVRDAGSHEAGTVVDVRLAVSGELDDSPSADGIRLGDQPTNSFVLFGLRAIRRKPADRVVRLLRWRHRGTFLALWEDTGAVEPRVVRLRAGFRRYSPILRTD
jgi:hypothetical protein